MSNLRYKYCHLINYGSHMIQSTLLVKRAQTPVITPEQPFEFFSLKLEETRAKIQDVKLRAKINLPPCNLFSYNHRAKVHN